MGKVTVVPHVYPRVMRRSPEFTRLLVNGQPAAVLHTPLVAFASVDADGPVEILLKTRQPVKRAVVRPTSRGVTCSVNGDSVAFTLPGPMDVSVEIDNLPPLHLHVNAINLAPPGDGPNVLRFAAGQVYEVGELTLESGQTLYIEGGAVVRGSIRAKDARDLKILGHGVIDGGYYAGERGTRTILLQDCPGVLIDGVTIINPTSWMTQLNACHGAVVRNYRGIADAINGTDGVDIVGCRDVLVEHCFIRNHDDQVVVKAFQEATESPENITVRNCVFANVRNGNAMEIGHELRTDYVRNVVWRDIDVIASHGHSAVFGIRAGDRATVTDVLYENVRVEHYYEKLIDFRVMKSRYNRDERRGQVRNVTIRNCTVAESEFNAGYSMSTIGGYDAEHTVENVRIENLTIGGRQITNADQLDLFTRHAHHITFA